MKIVKKIITEKPGAGRLGRHIEHDPQSQTAMLPESGLLAILEGEIRLS